MNFAKPKSRKAHATLSGRFSTQPPPRKKTRSPPEKPYPPSRVNPVLAVIVIKLSWSALVMNFKRAGRAGCWVFLPLTPAGGIRSKAKAKEAAARPQPQSQKLKRKSASGSVTC